MMGFFGMVLKFRCFRRKVVLILVGMVIWDFG